MFCRTAETAAKPHPFRRFRWKLLLRPFRLRQVRPRRQQSDGGLYLYGNLLQRRASGKERAVGQVKRFEIMAPRKCVYEYWENGSLRIRDGEIAEGVVVHEEYDEAGNKREG